MNITNTYGLQWEDRYAQIDVEMAMIRFGGYFPHPETGFMCGQGLFHHYKALQIELWGDTEDHHRWSDLELKTILENRFTAIMGSRDSGKTHVALSRFALTDYFTFPNTTLILISSTDSRGLELRVWGDMKDLFDRAKGRHPWLPGNIVDAKKGLFTDALDSNNEIRDMRKGIIGIPCLGKGGEWIGGLEKYYGIKQKRRRLLGDECFPAGTLVDTPTEKVPIEKICAGDVVISAMGPRKVIETRSRISTELVRVRSKDGRVIICTPDHEFFTNLSWVRACNLSEKHYMLSHYETMRVLQEGVHSKSGEESFLFSELCVEAYPQSSRNEGVLFCCAEGSSQTKTGMAGCSCCEDETKQSDAQSGELQQGCCNDSCDGNKADCERRKRDRSNQGGMATDAHVPRSSMELSSQDWDEIRQWFSYLLQIGSCDSTSETWNRGRWEHPQYKGETISRSKEGHVFKGAWVDSVEVLKQDDPRFPHTGSDISGCTVHNLQVEGHPSYSVNGFIVHNCQFMRAQFLDSFANLDKGDFKGVVVGNPIGQGDPLDKMAEPVGGWDSIGEVTKTLTWKNKFGGVTINLVGTDSPNFDKETWSKYPYLIDQSDVERVKERYGADSMQFWSQIMGVRKAGLDAHRVLTRALCERNDAYKEVIWDGGESRIKVYALDAAFGGDRCVGGWIEFGKETNGPIVIRVNPPREIQLEMSSGKTLEEQIAQNIKDEITVNGIPSANVFFDAGMRATLATEISKVVGTDVNAVNFQGNPTARPVSADDFVFDEKTQSKRHKRCDEHYSKFVTELWFSVRYAVLSRQIREFPTQVAEEFFMREWIKVTGDRYEIESKKDMKERVGYSPDLADWMAIAVEGARRLGFVIERMSGEDVKRTELDDWLEKEVSQHRQMMRKTQLTYT